MSTLSEAPQSTPLAQNGRRMVKKDHLASLRRHGCESPRVGSYVVRNGVNRWSVVRSLWLVG